MRLMSIKKVVVGIDFSEGSDAAMEQAFSLAAVFKANVDLVHVVEPGILAAPAALGSMALVDGPALFEQIDEALTARAEKASAAGLVCQTNSLQGIAAREIVRHAQKVGADLIVVGTHGRTGMQHVVLGSVAERVVQHSPCPVLVIPQRGRAN
jgi:nucleotide-binding universal stress UspA family protein